MKDIKSRKERATFFSDNIGKKYRVFIDNRGEFAEESWDQNTYISKIKKIIQTDEKILADPSPYHLLSKITKIKVLGLPVPKFIMNFITFLLLKQKIAYVGVNILEITKSRIRFQSFFLDEDRQLVKSVNGYYVELN